MKKLLLIVLVSLIFASVKSQISGLTIDLRINKVYYIYSSDLSFDGTLNFTNNTNTRIVLPKTFDLELIVADSLGQIIKIDPKAIFEYVNLLSFKKSQKIKPTNSFSASFTEWRFNYFPVIKGNYYTIQYSLTTDYSKKLTKFFGKTTFYSNKQSIKIPLP